MLTFLLVLFFIGIVIIICGIGFFIFDIIKSKPFKSTAILTVIGLILSIGSYQIAQKRMAHEDAVAVKQEKKAQSISESKTIAKYIKSHSGESKTSTDISESSSSIVESSSSSESVPQSAKYQAKLNSLNKGTAESASYDASTNTVTWIGFDDWKTWSDSELQKSMDLLQTMTLRQESNYDISNVHIVVQLPDGTVIAKNSDTDMDLKFIK